MGSYSKAKRRHQKRQKRQGHKRQRSNWRNALWTKSKKVR